MLVTDSPSAMVVASEGPSGAIASTAAPSVEDGTTMNVTTAAPSSEYEASAVATSPSSYGTEAPFSGIEYEASVPPGEYELPVEYEYEVVIQQEYETAKDEYESVPPPSGEYESAPPGEYEHNKRRRRLRGA